MLVLEVSLELGCWRLEFSSRSFQNRHCRRMSLRVAQADEHDPSAARFQQFSSCLMQDNERFPALLASDLHILPAKLRADPCSECLRDRFFGCETRRQKRS